ncbi:MAG TPA: dTMP kinase [Pirellulales bacterium]|jgi:dTMP kinase|nr:dTMP kinase [Pirellulales bacterium]
MFVSFDGIDGAGKSTQIEQFCAWLRQRGHEVVACRDPGSTPAGEAIRDLLLQRQNIAIGSTAEMLLYMAARSQLVDEVVRPALAAGKTIVSDRYLLANVVYQGHAGGVDVEQIWSVGQVATQGLMPDLAIVLDLPLAAATARLNRPLDRMERRGAEFLSRVRDGFLREAARQPDRVVVVDASGSIDEVQSEICRVVQRKFPGL